MDALESVVDEVALEGLDGITISSLWTRLENRIPQFTLTLDASTKEYLWKSLVSSVDISFYELPEARKPIVLTDRFAEIDPETGIQEIRRLSLDADDTVYPVHIIQDNKDGIQGSCLYFKERKDITKKLRQGNLTPILTLEQVVSKWGERLVAVASQWVRYRTLIGPEGDPELKLTDTSYCILERLGRARWQGELQRDLHSNTFKVDARRMHYLRRSLDRNNMITMQTHVIRMATGGQQCSILLLLKRFHVDRRGKYDILMECTSNILSTLPNNIGIMIKLRHQLHVSERTFKRVYHYMVAAKLVEVLSLPLHKITPGAGPIKSKKGNDIVVRCLKLLKPYGKKEEEDDDDDDDNDGKSLIAEGRDIERDVASQAYEIVVTAGTRGIAQSELRKRLHIGKLEGRMICRLLERNDMIKGFMEDEGRQRTTKYISKLFVEQSELNKQFTKEKKRCELNYSVGAGTPPVATATSAPPAPKRRKVAASSQQEEEEEEGAVWEARSGTEQEQEQEPDPEMDPELTKVQEPEPGAKENQEEEGAEGGRKGRGKGKGKERARGRRRGGEDAQQAGVMTPGTRAASESPLATPTCRLRQTTLSFTHSRHSTPHKAKTPPSVNLIGEETLEVLEQEAVEEDFDQSDVTMNTINATDPVPSSSLNQLDESVTVVEEVLDPGVKLPGKARSSGADQKVTYRLLKRKNMIIEAVRSLRIIENIFTLQKMLIDEEKADGVSTKVCKKSIVRLVRCLSREGLLRLYRTTVIQDGISKKVEFVVHPSITPDDPLIKSAIEQIRFRISGSYSALRLRALEEKKKDKEPPKLPTKPPHKMDQKMGVKPLPKNFRPSIVPGYGRALGFQPKMPRLRLVHTFIWYVVYGHPLRQSQASEAPAFIEEVNQSTQEVATDAGQEVEMGTQEVASTSTQEQDLGTLSEDMHVYVDEVSWKRYVPPVPLHKEFGPGWALTSDILISLPLSLLIQIVHISYKVDGLEQYLNDPVKKHYLVRFLPSAMKRQLLYKRKYVFSFYECMERICSMGLMQFGPVEKFQEKDQVFVYMKRNGTITDTTTCEPHYNLARSARPFEHRRYQFHSAQDVDSYWFDLLCVCLNTPLGLIRPVPTEGESEREKPDPHKYPRIRQSLPRSHDITDDGVTPGDGLGAGGLDSEFYAHLKRNWIWNSHQLEKTKNTAVGLQSNSNVRLRNLLNKHLLSKSVFVVSDNGSPGNPKLLLPKVVEEEVQVAIEPSSRNQLNRGGRKQKRKRLKKQKEKKEKKEKKPKKPVVRQFLDKTDRDALLRMTRKRVAWCQQEDSLLMLCRVACHFLNRKIKKAFVPWQVVRDLLHAEFEASLDKTSHAVGRRARYIMKNPQTYLNFKICLAEVYQDKPLVAEFNNRTQDYSNPQVCTEEFKEFVAVLRKKFSKASGSCKIEIPDTKQELFQKFKVYAIGDDSSAESKDVLKSEEDIHSLVLNNLIQSTLAVSNHQVKAKLSYQMFHLYSRYDHALLYDAFLRCQKNGLVNRRRNEQRYEVKKDRSLPIMPMSYQLSQSYYKVFTWRFPASVFTEAYDYLEKLIQAGGVDQPSAIYIQPQEKEKEKEKEREEKEREEEEKEREEEKDGGEVEEKKENEMERTEDTEMRNEGDGPPSGPEQRSPEAGGDEGPSGAPGLRTEEPQTDALLSAENLEGMVQFPLDSAGGACLACLSLMTLGLLSVDVSIPEQIVVVDTNMLDSEVVKRLAKEVLEEDEEDGEGEEANESRKRVGVKASQASHTTYLLMRGYCMPGILSSRVRVTSADSVVVNACTLHARLRRTPAHTLFGHRDTPILSAFLSPGQCEVPERLCRTFLSEGSDEGALARRLEAEPGYGAADVSAALEVWRSVEEGRSYGAERRELLRRLRHLAETQGGRRRTLQHYIQDLVCLQELVEVGGRSLRLVSLRQARSWLLQTVHVPGQSPAHALHALRALRLPEWRHQHQQRGRQARKRPLGLEHLVRERPAGGGPGGEEEEAEEEEEEEEEGAGEPPRKRAAGSEREREVAGEEADAGGGGFRGTSTMETATVDAGSTEAGEEEEEGQGEGSGGAVWGGAGGGRGGGDEEHVCPAAQPSSTCSTDGQQTDSSELKDAAGSLSPGEDQSVDHISFLSRPWRSVDGSVNRAVCKGMLEGLLAHIMSRPGVTEAQLTQHYSLVLQPVTVLDLVQTLVELGCVRRRYLRPVPRASLFSPAQQVEVRGEEVAGHHGYVAFYEPSVEAGLVLAKAYPHEKNWNHWSAVQNKHLKQPRTRESV